MRQVLIGDFGVIIRMGLQELLEHEGLQVVGQVEQGGTIAHWVNELRPDVVFLDHDDEGTFELAAWISSEFPAIKVVACSSEAPVMRVFPAFHHGESYVSELSRRLLSQELRT